MSPRFNPRVVFCALAALALVLEPAAPLMADPLGSAITYQGHLKNAGSPANGLHTMEFRLFPVPAGGSPIGAALIFDGVSNSQVNVMNGLFTVELDFGASSYNGDKRWLDITVAGTPLVPRQELTPAPHARFSAAPWTTSGSNISYTGGNVGIGSTTPAAKLDIAGNTRAETLTLTGTETLDQAQENADIAVNNSDVWQSFTAGQTGILTRVEYNAGFAEAPGNAELSVYSGEGLAGTLLGTQSYTLSVNAPSLVSIPLTNGAPVMLGQQYTLRFRRILGGINHTHQFQSTNPYAGGRYSGNPGSDMRFRTYVRAGGIEFADGTIQLTAANRHSLDATDGSPTDALLVDNDGNVGIGTGTPGMVLDVKPNDIIGNSTVGVNQHDASNQGTKVSFGYRPDGTTEFLGLRTLVGPGTNGCGNTGDIRFDTWECNTAASREVMRITGSGNVGIGTTSPQSALHVTPISGITLGQNSGGNTALRVLLTQPQGGAALLQAIAAGGVSYGDLLLNRDGGNVGIGTTSPAERLHINGNIRFGDGTTQSTAYRPIIDNAAFGSFFVSGNGSIILSKSGISGATVGMSVIVTPPYDLSSRHVLAWSRVSAPGEVRFAIDGNGGGDHTYAPGTWRITVLP